MHQYQEGRQAPTKCIRRISSIPRSPVRRIVQKRGTALGPSCADDQLDMAVSMLEQSQAEPVHSRLGSSGSFGIGSPSLGYEDEDMLMPSVRPGNLHRSPSFRRTLPSR